MVANLLIDVGPADGDHGQRGIGRYVRGLAASIAAFPEDLASRVWAVGFPGPTLEGFGARATTHAAPRGLGQVIGWSSDRLPLNHALQQSGASVLHATDPQRPSTDPPIPSFVTVYDLIPLREPAILRSWRLDHRLAYRRYLQQIESAGRIVAISQATAEDLQERLHIAPDRIDIVYPVVTTPADFQRVTAPEPTFLCVGALDTHKQPELAVRALALFRSRFGPGRLVYVGPADPLKERRLLSLAAELGIGGSISFAGRVTDNDLEAAYGRATALLTTSRTEGFGLPPVEAALRGVPVIAIETPAARETLEGVAMIVPPDAGAIAEAMREPLEPPGPEVARMRERYSISSGARSLADTYRRMLA